MAQVESSENDSRMRRAINYQEVLRRSGNVKFPTIELDTVKGDCLESVISAIDGITFSYRKDGVAVTETIPIMDTKADVAYTDSAVFSITDPDGSPKMVFIGGTATITPFETPPAPNGSGQAKGVLNQYRFSSLPVKRAGIQPITVLEVATVAREGWEHEMALTISESFGGTLIRQTKPFPIGTDPVMLPELRIMDNQGVDRVDTIFPNGSVPKMRTHLPFKTTDGLQARFERFGADSNIPCLTLQKQAS